MIHTYLVALGSNMRVPGIGAPPRVIDAAVVALEMAGIDVTALSATIASRPVGPSMRSYANAAARVECDLAPPDMLAAIQEIEDDFGRRRRGARWRARPLDLDIILWSGGLWHSPDLTIPHPSFRERDFVLAPAAAIAPDWCDPVTGLTLRQISARAS
ncbi:2-amino-4-hydroxy-6-hydroxymethyldihydropteridine diphosphokinase [Qipengyuania vesicularis]|uniref:2-amino-4-hydroxy-6- hydroxymethyldihydropteridine diphosphokinase n=1 Tax=Qipengyuania vesicularis TaxID=2867232 RepID=UPI0031E65F3D